MQVEPTRFERLLAEQYRGNEQALLTDFELAYAHWRSTPEDESAREQWTALLLALCGAGNRGIGQAPRLFLALGEILRKQIGWLPPTARAPHTALAGQVRQLAEDLEDAADPALQDRGIQLRATLTA